MGQDGANRYAYVYNHPTTFIDPSGFDGFYFDFDMDYSFDFSPSYDISFDFAPNMSVGTAGYYTPPTDFSGGTSQMSYAGGQSYVGDSGEWGAAGAYCADSYSSYMSAQFGAFGGTLAAQQLNGFQNPVSSWYPDDSSLAYAQNACLAFATGCAIAATYGAAAAAAPLVYAYASDLLGMTAATSPELVAAGTGAMTGATQYAVQNAPELESLVPEVSSVAAEGGGIGQETLTLYHGSIDNYSNIMSQGFDVARTPTWVTTSLEAAQNAIGQSRVLSSGQGFDVGIVTSVVPAHQFSAIQQLGGISDLRRWPGFGGGPDFSEFGLRSPAAIDLFNSGIVR